MQPFFLPRQHFISYFKGSADQRYCFVSNVITTCHYNLLQICQLRHATSLFQQTCYNLTTISTCHQLVPTSLIWLVVNKLGKSCFNNLLQFCIPTTCQQDVNNNNLLQVVDHTTSQQVVSTTLQQVVLIKLVTTFSNSLLQFCKSTTYNNHASC